MMRRETVTKPQETSGGINGINMEIEECTKRLELLYDIAEKTNSISEVSKLLEEVLTITQRALRASASSLCLVDWKKRLLYVQSAGGIAADKLKQMRLDLNSGIVGWVANHRTPLIINDVPRDKRFNRDIDRATGFTTKSILTAPVVRRRKAIGVIEVLNKNDGSAFNDRDLRVLTRLASTEAIVLLVSIVATAITNIERSQIVLDGYKSAIEGLVRATDARDLYSLGHSQRVKKYALLAAGSLSFSSEELQAIECGALLHDIGKISVYESILRKPDALTAEELYVIHKHPKRGADILGVIPSMEKAREIVLHHHERYDGKGYPEGLKGNDIPIGARLVAVADAFDTMTTDHSYRRALSAAEAMHELIEGECTQFCPVATKALIDALIKKPDPPPKVVTTTELKLPAF